MKKKRVILVSGMSGAGKTSATSVLEDMGYHCIDQFPVQLLSLLVDLIESSTDPRYSYLALATSAKDFPEFLNAFEGEDMDVRVLFLDASNDVLLHRYKSTRRTHPLLISNVCNTLEEAISVERQMFQNYKDTAFLSVDTTFLKASELKQKIEKYFSLSSAPVFSISFISFGYKHGVPLDALSPQSLLGSRTASLLRRRSAGLPLRHGQTGNPGIYQAAAGISRLRVYRICQGRQESLHRSDWLYRRPAPLRRDHEFPV